MLSVPSLYKKTMEMFNLASGANVALAVGFNSHGLRHIEIEHGSSVCSSDCRKGYFTVPILPSLLHVLRFGIIRKVSTDRVSYLCESTKYAF
jgi:hypothetical protein